MGAAGYVRIYDAEKVREHFKLLWPEHDIDEDWWYLKTITADLNGRAYIFDYMDDQGHHSGSGESFWFKMEPDESSFTEETKAQKRVLKALSAAGVLAYPEVWT